MGKLILPEQTKIVEALAPASDGAGRAGGYVTLKDAARVYVVVHIEQAAATAIPLTIEQAQDVEGTNAKALTNNAQIWANLDAGASDSLVRQTDAVSFDTDAGIKNKIVVFQVDARSLDVNNGFDCIVVNTGANDTTTPPITSALYILTDLRYQSDDTPSAIVD